jgi:hypothetical protein
MPATAPDPEERGPLSPRDEAIFAEIIGHLRTEDPALAARLSRRGDGHLHVRATACAVGALLVPVLLVTQAPSAVWLPVGLLIAIRLLPLVLLGAIERHNRC